MDTLNMKRTKSDRVHRSDCPHLPPFPTDWLWPDKEGFTTHEAVAEYLRANAGRDFVKPCGHCLPATSQMAKATDPAD